MASRTTEWRRRKYGLPKAHGRRVRNPKIEGKTLVRSAMLIEEALRSPGAVDYVAVRREEVARVQSGDVKSIFTEIAKWPFPADLVAVATCDVFTIGRRRRRRAAPIWTEAVIAERLREAVPSLSKSEAINHALAYHRGDEEAQWIDVILQPMRNEPIDERRCCMSHIFHHINRRMSSYWRNDPRFKQCVSQLRGIARNYAAN